MTRSEEMGFKIKTIQTDLTGEFATGKKFISWLQEKGISHEMSAPYSQYQNGIMERHIQMIEDCATTILITSGLPNGFWGKAMLYAVKTWNMTTNEEKTPYKMVTRRKYNILMLKPFGCRVFIRKPLKQ